MSEFSLKEYPDLLRLFLQAGYAFKQFQDQDIRSENRIVILRHDVDFSLESAHSMARVEAMEGIFSTFFFMINSPLYNLLSNQALRIVTAIGEMGHAIGLHFDPLSQSHKDGVADRLKRELTILSSYYPFANLRTISLHRTGTFLNLLSELPLGDIQHTYDPRYFVKGQYFSDSRGQWGTDGNPTLSPAFKSGLGIQLTVHPMWWDEGGTDNFGKLDSFLNSVRLNTIDYLEESIISFSLQSLKNNNRK
jgi:hypothetical protein